MANSSKLPMIVGGVVILAVAVGTFLVQRGDDTPQEVVAPVAPTTVAAADASGSAGANPRTGAGPGIPGDRVAQSLDRRRTMREGQIERTAKVKADAASRYERETVDPAWAPQKEVELNAIAATPEFGIAGVAPQKLDVDCKSSMCRLNGQFASNGEAEDWVLMYMSSVGGNLPNSVVSRRANPDGTTSIEIYGRAR